MSQPKEFKLGGDQPAPIPENDEPQRTSSPIPRAPDVPLPNAPDDALSYADRFGKQRYHPVVLIGSAGSGKTVLLLSLLAYFKSGGNEKQLSVFFGDDLFRPADKTLFDDARRYFNMTVAQYIAGTTDAATAIDAPMFIPVKVCGESGRELKFALMESNGEAIHPDARKGADYFPAFHDKLAGLLRQYADGISFIWVAPRAIPGRAVTVDPEDLMRRANESLLGAIANYKALRSNNSAQDTHMLLVTQWDTHVSELLPGQLYENLDRRNDAVVSHEVENFLLRSYSGAYTAFQSLNSSRKVVFRYSAGLFNARSRTEGELNQILRTYSRDIWNWLYEAMRICHKWSVDAGPLIPIPPPPTKSWLQRWDEFISKIFG